MTLHPSAHVDTFSRDRLPPPEQWPTFEFTLPELQYPPRLNAAVALLDAAVEAHGPDRPALLTPDGERWTYGELQRRANQVAQVLTEDLGVVPGTRVMLRSPNNPWTVACWLGAVKAGAVVVATMFALRAREIATLVESTEPAVALCDHHLVDDMVAARELVGESAAGLQVLAHGGDGDDDLAARCATKSGEFTAVETSCDDVVLLGPTSGTTGRPKITMHFHRDVLATAETFSRHVLKPVADDVFACTAPLAFTFGLGGLVIFPFHVGAAVLLVEKATPVQLADMVAEHGVTVLFTAPTAYKQILREGKQGQLAGVRSAVSAGEHLPQATWQEYADTIGLRIIDGIGSTEMLHIFISAAGDDIRPGATGRAVPGYRATTLADDGSEAAPGERGRLAVIGPTGCRYLSDDRQRAYVHDGWNLTGDTYIRDDDGYFVYQARSDNMIVSSGYNIGGPEVEEAIAADPDVVECAVVAKPDPDRGSVVCAFVVLRDGVTGDEAKVKALQDHVKAALAPYKYPRDVRFVDALPRNPSGKLQHFKLRDRLADEA